MEVLARGGAGVREALDRLSRLRTQIARRGACAHPDGALRFAGSALTIFADEISHHLAGRCTVTSAEPVLQTHSYSSWAQR